MSLNRLQKIISESSLLSRLKADLLIKQGRATLNGRQAILGHPLQVLQRISISSIHLYGLQEVKWRKLKTKEWISIIN